MVRSQITQKSAGAQRSAGLPLLGFLLAARKGFKMEGLIEKGKAMREATWEEYDEQHKIEKLKKELKRTQRQVKDLCGFVKVLLRHEHNGKRLVQPINQNSQCEEDGGSLYFHVDEFR